MIRKGVTQACPSGDNIYVSLFMSIAVKKVAFVLWVPGMLPSLASKIQVRIVGIYVYDSFS